MPTPSAWLALTTFGRFVAIGVLAAVSYLSLTLILQRIMGVATIASVAAYTIAIVIHFTLNNFYTFRKCGIERKTILRYSITIAAFAVLSFFVDDVVRTSGLPSSLLYFTNIILAPILSFLAMKTYVFGR